MSSTSAGTGTDLDAQQRRAPAPRRRRAPQGPSRATRLAWGLFGLIVTLAVWWTFTHAAAGANSMMAAFQPERLPGAIASLADRGVVLQDAATSLWRLLCGLAIAAVWPVALNTASGVAALDPLHVRVARTLGATRPEILRTVVLPSIRPFTMTGVRLALGIAWVVIVPAEMLGVSSGLGYEILNARDRLAYDEMLVVILLIGLIGIALDTLAQWLLRERSRG